MIKILFVNLTGQMAGAEHSLFLIAKHLYTRFSLTLACPNTGSLPQHFAQMGIVIQALPQPPAHKFLSPRGICYWLCISWVLLKIILTTRPNIIHANTFAALACTLFPARLTGKHLIAHARDFHRQSWPVRLLGLGCHQIVAVSHAVKSHLITQGVDPKKITIIHNGVDLPSESIPTLRHSGGPFTFAHIGQFVPWKNQLLFLHAAARFLCHNPHARFLLIGDDIFHRNHQYKQKVATTIKQLNLTDHVESLGWQSCMSHIWPRINVLVHTAATEPFGRVIIEAIVRAIPVIAVNRNGPAEILQHVPSAFLIDPDSPDQLASAMHKMSRRSYAMPLSTTERIAQNFSASNTASQVASLYHHHLKGTPRAHRHTLSYL